MVFSQTSLRTQSILKVVELDRLKPNKKQVNVLNGVVTDANSGSPPLSPAATTSYCEEYLKPEPVFESKMFHDSDCEFFQDLVQWCSAPAKEEPVQTIDSPKLTEERAHNTDTPQMLPFSPQGWDAFDANSPTAQAAYHNTTPNDSLSPNIDGFLQFDTKFLYPPDLDNEKKTQFHEKFLDISSLPVVIGDLASERAGEPELSAAAESVGWSNTHDTHYTEHTTEHNRMPFIDQEDSLDMKVVTSVIPREVESNDVIISEYIINDDLGRGRGLEEPKVRRRGGGLTVDVAASAPVWAAPEAISTPDVVSYVEQLEKEKCSLSRLKPTKQWPAQETLVSTDTCSERAAASPVDYQPITPKSESHIESDNDDAKSHSSKKRRRDSEDSDETYTPYSERSTPRNYKRRRPNVPIKDMIIALEGSQQLTKARRGRPPKRRESTVSSVCSIDDTCSSISTQDVKYRELRDKNNEASKRSRMNRKLKELQMEQLAVELEERNKKLKVKADILEDMTKRLKDALMTAILQK